MNQNTAANIIAATQHQVALNSADYLAQLIKDKKQLSAFPSYFLHIQRLLDEEIARVRQSLFVQLPGSALASDGASSGGAINQFGAQAPRPTLELPEPEGDLVELKEKVYVPVESHPEYNFVGRILGPRGMTAKQLELETGCKIKIRGRGSMRDKKRVSSSGDFLLIMQQQSSRILCNAIID